MYEGARCVSLNWVTSLSRNPEQLLFLPGWNAALCHKHRVISRLGKKGMQLAPTHPHVPSIIEREHERISQQALQWRLLRVAFHADQAHRIVDDLHREFRTIDLGH